MIKAILGSWDRTHNIIYRNMYKRLYGVNHSHTALINPTKDTQDPRS